MQISLTLKGKNATKAKKILFLLDASIDHVQRLKCFRSLLTFMQHL